MSVFSALVDNYMMIYWKVINFDGNIIQKSTIFNPLNLILNISLILLKLIFHLIHVRIVALQFGLDICHVILEYFLYVQVDIRSA